MDPQEKEKLIVLVFSQLATILTVDKDFIYKILTSAKNNVRCLKFSFNLVKKSYSADQFKCFVINSFDYIDRAISSGNLGTAELSRILELLFTGLEFVRSKLSANRILEEIYTDYGVEEFTLKAEKEFINKAELWAKAEDWITAHRLSRDPLTTKNHDEFYGIQCNESDISESEEEREQVKEGASEYLFNSSNEQESRQFEMSKNNLMDRSYAHPSKEFIIHDKKDFSSEQEKQADEIYIVDDSKVFELSENHPEESEIVVARKTDDIEQRMKRIERQCLDYKKNVKLELGMDDSNDVMSLFERKRNELKASIYGNKQKEAQNNSGINHSISQKPVDWDHNNSFSTLKTPRDNTEIRFSRARKDSKDIVSPINPGNAKPDDDHTFTSHDEVKAMIAQYDSMNSRFKQTKDAIEMIRGGSQERQQKEPVRTNSSVQPVQPSILNFHNLTGVQNESAEVNTSSQSLWKMKFEDERKRNNEALQNIDELNHLLAKESEESQTLREEVFNLKRVKETQAREIDSYKRTIEQMKNRIESSQTPKKQDYLSVSTEESMQLESLTQSYLEAESLTQREDILALISKEFLDERSSQSSIRKFLEIGYKAREEIFISDLKGSISEYNIVPVSSQKAFEALLEFCLKVSSYLMKVSVSSNGLGPQKDSNLSYLIDNLLKGKPKDQTLVILIRLLSTNLPPFDKMMSPETAILIKLITRCFSTLLEHFRVEGNTQIYLILKEFSSFFTNHPPLHLNVHYC